jgi:alpha-beta hydrolase superfamily lysophospholipase
MKLTVQGREAYAYTGGKPFDPALPCVVFVHGALHDHSCWTLLARWCAHHGHSVLAVDLPGHARSAGPPLAMSRPWPTGCSRCSTPPACGRRRWSATAWVR